ncbi:MAG: TetR/AcrR family transcriptional regulator [Actinomycetota bacterium]
MSDGTARDDGRVNPRTQRVCAAILDAATALLREHGPHEVTIARTAERADVARTTIYRHWPDQRSLLLAAIDQLTVPHHDIETTGRLADDVWSALDQLRTRMVKRSVRSMFAAFGAHAARDTAFSDGQRRFALQLGAPTCAVLRDAQDRGDLDQSIDCDVESNLLAGAVIHQYVTLHNDVNDDFLDLVVDRWLERQSRTSHSK